MGSGFYPALREILLAHGCWAYRQGKGSHEMWHSPINAAQFPVAVSILSRPLANKILKRAGIKRKV